MQKKISPIDPESIFAQDIGLRKFSEASQSSKLGRSEINSLFAAVGSRALRDFGEILRSQTLKSSIFATRSTF